MFSEVASFPTFLFFFSIYSAVLSPYHYHVSVHQNPSLFLVPPASDCLTQPLPLHSPLSSFQYQTFSLSPIPIISGNSLISSFHLLFFCFQPFALLQKRKYSILHLMILFLIRLKQCIITTTSFRFTYLPLLHFLLAWIHHLAPCNQSEVEMCDATEETLNKNVLEINQLHTIHTLLKAAAGKDCDASFNYWN